MKALLNNDRTEVLERGFNYRSLKNSVYPSTIPPQKVFTTEMWESFNVLDVVDNGAPDFDEATQKLGPVGVVVENGVPVKTYTVIDLTEEELSEKASLAALQQTAEEKVAERAAKLAGVEILGVMCSATGKDQAGLTAVAVGAMRAQLAGQSFSPTEFTFENGTVLTITPENFSEIEAIWTPFRQSFYAVGE